MNEGCQLKSEETPGLTTKYEDTQRNTTSALIQ